MSPIELLIYLFLLGLVVSLVGFARTVWFISIGYAASIFAFVLAAGFIYYERFTLLGLAQLSAALVWSTRLGVFLARRERSQAYRAAVRTETDRSQSLGLTAKLGIWVSVSALYVCMFSPAVFLGHSATSLDPNEVLLGWAGVGVMWLGLILEAMADQQKSRLKAADPNAFARTGLYAWVRYPNYLGEILFWLGNFVAGIVAYANWWQWLMALIGGVCIVLIMLGSTKRMEFKQDDRYGEDPAYRDYTRSVPVLIPWVPLYTIKNIRVYLE